MLVERLDDRTLEVTWKFPSASSNEELLLSRVEYLWREATLSKCRILYYDSTWQSLDFGSGFALILESSHRPSLHDWAWVSHVAGSYDKNRNITDLVRMFLQLKRTDSSHEASYYNSASNELLDLLRSFSTSDDAACLWWFCKHGRVRLMNGSSGELAEAARTLARRADAEFVPLILGPTSAELGDLRRLGAYICCQPTDEFIEPGDCEDLVYWDVSVDWKRRTLHRKRPISQSEEEVSIARFLNSCETDEQFVVATDEVVRLRQDDSLL